LSPRLSSPKSLAGSAEGKLTTTERCGRREIEQSKVGAERARRVGASESKSTKSAEIKSRIGQRRAPLRRHRGFRRGSTQRNRKGRMACRIFRESHSKLHHQFDLSQQLTLCSL
jgi:hypothetical protein